MKKRLAVILAFLLTSCCTMVSGESGTVTAINFVPEKTPKPWIIYLQMDADARPYIIEESSTPSVKVGDHVTLRYTDWGGYMGLKKTKRVAQ